MVVVTTTNQGDAAIDVALSSTYGSKAIYGLQPGATSSVVFSTRLSRIPAGEVTATAAGSSVIAAYSAAMCG